MYVETVLIFDDDDGVESSTLASILIEIESELQRANQYFGTEIFRQYPGDVRFFLPGDKDESELYKPPALKITGTFNFEYPKDLPAKNPPTLWAQIRVAVFSGVALMALSAAGSQGSSVLGDTQLGKDARAGTINLVDKFYSYVKETLNRDTEHHSMKCEMIDGRIVIVVKPHKHSHHHHHR